MISCLDGICNCFDTHEDDSIRYICKDASNEVVDFFVGSMDESETSESEEPDIERDEFFASSKSLTEAEHSSRDDFVTAKTRDFCDSNNKLIVDEIAKELKDIENFKYFDTHDGDSLRYIHVDSADEVEIFIGSTNIKSGSSAIKEPELERDEVSGSSAIKEQELERDEVNITRALVDVGISLREDMDSEMRDKADSSNGSISVKDIVINDAEENVCSDREVIVDKGIQLVISTTVSSQKFHDDSSLIALDCVSDKYSTHSDDNKDDESNIAGNEMEKCDHRECSETPGEDLPIGEGEPSVRNEVEDSLAVDAEVIKTFSKPVKEDTENIEENVSNSKEGNDFEDALGSALNTLNFYLQEMDEAVEKSSSDDKISDNDVEIEKSFVTTLVNETSSVGSKIRDEQEPSINKTEKTMITENKDSTTYCECHLIGKKRSQIEENELSMTTKSCDSNPQQEMTCTDNFESTLDDVEEDDDDVSEGKQETAVDIVEPKEEIGSQVVISDDHILVANNNMNLCSEITSSKDEADLSLEEQLSTCPSDEKAAEVMDGKNPQSIYEDKYALDEAALIAEDVDKFAIDEQLVMRPMESNIDNQVGVDIEEGAAAAAAATEDCKDTVISENVETVTTAVSASSIFNSDVDLNETNRVMVVEDVVDGVVSGWAEDSNNTLTAEMCDTNEYHTDHISNTGDDYVDDDEVEGEGEPVLPSGNENVVAISRDQTAAAPPTITQMTKSNGDSNNTLTAEMCDTNEYPTDHISDTGDNYVDDDEVEGEGEPVLPSGNENVVAISRDQTAAASPTITQMTKSNDDQKNGVLVDEKMMDDVKVDNMVNFMMVLVISMGLNGYMMYKFFSYLIQYYH